MMLLSVRRFVAEVGRSTCVYTTNLFYEYISDETNRAIEQLQLSILLKPQNITVAASSSASFDRISNKK